MKKSTLRSSSCQETQALAAKFAQALQGGEIIFLRGPIGAGKTVFVKGIARALGLKSLPTSASFSLMKEYKNKHFRLFHIDLFRLEENEVLNLGFEEMLEDDKAIILAEWPDPIRHLLPQDRLEMNFILQEKDRRLIEAVSYGPQADKLLGALCSVK